MALLYSLNRVPESVQPSIDTVLGAVGQTLEQKKPSPEEASYYYTPETYAGGQQEAEEEEEKEVEASEPPSQGKEEGELPDSQ